MPQDDDADRGPGGRGECGGDRGGGGELLDAQRCGDLLPSGWGHEVRKEQAPDLREIKSKVKQIAEAVRSTVPESMWPDILAKLPSGDKASESVGDDADDEEFDPLVDGYHRLDFAEDDDGF